MNSVDGVFIHHSHKRSTSSHTNCEIVAEGRDNN
jgi:hypothetical protein